MNYIGAACCANPFDQSLNSTDNVAFNSEILTGNLQVAGDTLLVGDLTVNGAFIAPNQETKQIIIDDAAGNPQTHIVQKVSPDETTTVFKTDGGSTFMTFDPSFGGRFQTEIGQFSNTVSTPVVDIATWQLQQGGIGELLIAPADPDGPTLRLAKTTNVPPIHTDMTTTAEAFVQIRPAPAEALYHRFNTTTDTPVNDWYMGLMPAGGPNDGYQIGFWDENKQSVFHTESNVLHPTGAATAINTNFFSLNGAEAKAQGATDGLALFSTMRFDSTDACAHLWTDEATGTGYGMGMQGTGFGGNATQAYNMGFQDISTVSGLTWSTQQGSGVFRRDLQFMFGLTAPFVYTGIITPLSIYSGSPAGRFTLPSDTLISNQLFELDILWDYVSSSASGSIIMEFFIGGAPVYNISVNPVFTVTPIPIKWKLRMYIPTVALPTTAAPRYADVAFDSELYAQSDLPYPQTFSSGYTAGTIDSSLPLLFDVMLSGADMTDTYTVHYATGRLIC